MKALINVPASSLKREKIASWLPPLFLISLALLPYLFYGSILGILIVLISLIRIFKRPCLDLLTLGGLVGGAGLMVVSALAALYRGEAVLQLANFLPYMLMFAYLPGLFRAVALYERLAIALLFTAIPINLIALGEYLIKSPRLPDSWQAIAWVEAIRSAPHVGRAMVMFDHPNVMASYLVVVMGLGLGLVALERVRPLTITLPLGYLITATLINLVGIFCSGSRNGLAIALSQLIIFAVVARLNRRILVAIAAAVGCIGLGTVAFGLGVRRIGIFNLSDDPRIGLWKISLDLIQQRPWLGWGLGSFKFLYPSRLIDPEYLDVFHPHNIWLLLATEAGLIVMVVLTVMVAFVCYRALRYSVLNPSVSEAHRAIAITYGLAFWGSVGFALFDVTFYDVRTNALNWSILAALYALPYESATDSHTPDPEDV